MNDHEKSNPNVGGKSGVKVKGYTNTSELLIYFTPALLSLRGGRAREGVSSL